MLEPAPHGRVLRARKDIAVRRFAGHRAMQEDLGDAPLRVAQLSDLHVGLVTPQAVQLATVALVNAQKPDLVALTGDYVARSLRYVDTLEELLGRIQAPKIAVLGNHDHWHGADEVRAALRRSGVEVLDNAWTELELGGRRLRIVGLDDDATGNADLREATKGLPDGGPVLGLSHIGEMADELWDHGVQLVLSGHTHAGHVVLEEAKHWTLPGMMGHRYVHGLYGCRRGQRAPGALYVSAGIGASVFGLRLGERARREIPVFELGLAPGSIEEHHEEQVALPGKAGLPVGRGRVSTP